MTDDRLVKTVLNLSNKFNTKRRGSSRVLETLIESNGLCEQYEKMCNKELIQSKWELEVRKRVREIDYRKWTSEIERKQKGVLYHEIHKAEFLEFKEKSSKKFRMKHYLKQLNEISRLKFKLRSGTSGLNEEKGRQRGKLEERVCECCDQNEVETVPHFLLKCSRFEGIRDVFLYSVEKDVEFVKKWTESSDLEKCIILLKDYLIEVVREKDNSEDEKESIQVVSESDNVEDDDLDDIIFNLPCNFFSDVSGSTDIVSGVDVSVPVVRNGVVGVNSEVVVVSSNSVALTKLQTKKNLVNCIDKF
eukprot:Awhi_evm1s8663